MLLPPRLRPSTLAHIRRTAVCSSLIPRTLPSAAHSRSLWGWRKGCTNYTSHLDPMYQKFARHRTLKTRAKLLDRLRRRGKWEWDIAQRPFFSPRQLRLASHWNGTGRSQWSGDKQAAKDEEKADERDDGYELSSREKEWKDQMEWMRRRIETDPYEAVFGKRFEPFWHPFFSNWAREDSGSTSQSNPKRESADTSSSSKSPSSKQSNESIVPAVSKREIDADSNDSPNGQLTNYSYASTSSTSWDSWTKKARRTEWDSISGEKRRYEYDPISNRMIRVELSQAKEPAQVDAREPERAHSSESESKSASETKAVDVSDHEHSKTRKAISVPTQTTQTQKSTYFPSLINNNSSAPNSTSQPSMKVESSTQHMSVQGNDLEGLTADDVRASVGRGKRDTMLDQAKRAENAVNDTLQAHDLRVDLDRKYAALKQKLEKMSFKDAESADLSQANHLRPSVDRLQSKELPRNVELDDSAAHESTGDRTDGGVPRDWHSQADVLQAERIMRTRGGLSSSGEYELWKRPSMLPRWIDDMNARKARYEAKMTAKSPEEQDTKLDKAQMMLENEVREQKLRMQAHESRRGQLEQQVQGLSLATEKTGEVERYRQRIRAQREELDTAFKQSSAQAEMHVERIRNLEAELNKFKTSNTLDGEKERFVRKIRDLRAELDRTFKQSAVQGEMQVERIKELERELHTARADKVVSSKGVEATRAEGDFCANVVKHAKDSSKWYKQPASYQQVRDPLAEREKDKQKVRDMDLVREVKDIYEARYGKIDPTHRQSTVARPRATVDESLAAFEKKPPQVVEVESNVDLGNALADYEKEQKYGYKRDGLEKEMKAEEKEVTDLNESLRSQAAEENAAHEAQAAVNVADPPKPAIASSQSPTIQPSKQPPTPDQPLVPWAHPPEYKIVSRSAWGRDLTTIDTSSSFGGTEEPISIAVALKRSKTPDYWVEELGRLHKDGYQVIHASEYFWVFRKLEKEASKVEELAKVNEKVRERASMLDGSVNPIDGTARPTEPDTGSFASPTGFVGDRHDAIGHEKESGSGEPQRVKRQERVFSGHRSVDVPHTLNAHSGSKRWKAERKKWRSWRSRARWVLSVGVGAAGLAYGVGAVAEGIERRK